MYFFCWYGFLGSTLIRTTKKDTTLEGLGKGFGEDPAVLSCGLCFRNLGWKLCTYNTWGFRVTVFQLLYQVLNPLESY